MLPDLRFVIGAGLATALLVVTAFGVAATLRLAHQTKVGPLEASRSLAYADQTDWNQFQNPSATRRFEDMMRRVASDSLPPSLVPPAVADADAPQPVAPSPRLEASEPDTAGDLLVSNLAAGGGQDADLTADAAQDLLGATSVPPDGGAPPIADDKATPVDLDSVIGPAPGVPLPDAATATKPIETHPVEFAAVESPAMLAASDEPVRAAPEPSSGSDRVASIPATFPGDIRTVEPRPPLPKTAPARRPVAKATPQARRAVRRSRPSIARTHTIRAASTRIDRARPAAQQPFAPTGFTATTGQPNNVFNNRQYNANGFNNTGFNTNRPVTSQGGN